MRTCRNAAFSLVLGVAIGLAAPPALAPALASAATVPAHTIVLTNASNGSSVVALRGDRVVVELTGGPLRWSEAGVAPSPSGIPPALVRVSGSVSSTGSSRTVFRVVGYGAASLEAVGAPICAPVPICPTFVVLWRAQVLVPVQDPPGGVAP